MFNGFNLMEIILRVPAIILAMTVHEFSHGLAAYKLGDSTAKYDGRLSLNPMAHIDPVGLLCLLFFRFGWAKPVMVNPGNFKNYKNDMALTAFAGPLSNFIFAFVTMMVLYPATAILSGGFVTRLLMAFLYNLFFINLSLGIFNMLPLPPLDGSKIFGAILPSNVYYNLLRFERYGMVILMLLVFTGIISMFLGPLIDGAFTLTLSLVSKIYFFL